MSFRRIVTCIMCTLASFSAPSLHTALKMSRVQGEQWRNDRPCYPCYAGGGILPNLLVFKRKIVRLGSKMDHISVNLAFGRRKKNIWGYKKLQGRQKAYKKNRKKSGDHFFWGAPNVNVTPLQTSKLIYSVNSYLQEVIKC